MSTRPPGRLCVGLTAHGAVRLVVVECRDQAREVQRRHGLKAGAAELGGACTAASLLLSAYIKGDERISLQVQSEAPAFAWSADVDADGGVRGRLRPHMVPLPASGAVRGMLLAIKSNRSRELYRGVTPIEDVGLEQALQAHLSGSNQVDVVVRLGARLGSDGQVSQAWGLLVERLPEHPSQASLTPEAFAQRFKEVRSRPLEDLMVEVAFGKLAGQTVEVLDVRDLAWRCQCSQERVLRMLRSLGEAELRDMLEQDDGAEITCHFCTEVYRVDGAGLQALIDG